MQYRPYQQEGHDRIYAAWDAGHENVGYVLPTGGGKSLVVAGVINAWQRGKVIAIAHRKELVGQIAMALAQNGVSHQILGPSTLVKYVVNRQRQKLGTHFHNTNAKTIVASVDTLISPSRRESLNAWREQIGLWVTDEMHHILRIDPDAGLKGNKWGKACDLFPNAKGLGVTATPCRADGKGLGRHSDGVFDTLVEGPTMRDLIDAGYLCDYRIFAPLTYMPLSEEDVGASGDYSQQKLKVASKKSRIVGDVVASYQQYCTGLQAVVFATDVETAGDMCTNYRTSGIKAEVVSAETPDAQRAEILDRYERKEFQVLVNVDLLGEGFDCPGIEAVIFARPTESYGLYCQQFGRGLRPLAGKSHALMIDHVGNVVRHGLPDAPRLWTLDGKERTPRTVNPDDEIPLRYCSNCTQPYPRFRIECPWCGHYPTPDTRGRPEFVDGDILEISPEILAKLRGEIRKVDVPPHEIARRMEAAGANPKVIGGAFKNIEARTQMQSALRASMQWWGAIENARGYTDREAQRRFYWKFGTDVLSAQTLGRPEAATLAERINDDIMRG